MSILKNLTTKNLSGVKPSKGNPQAGSTQFYNAIERMIKQHIREGKLKLNKGETIQDIMNRPEFRKLINAARKQAPQAGTGYTRHKHVKLDGSAGRTNKRVRVMGEFNSGGKKFINQKRYKTYEQANKSKLS